MKANVFFTKDGKLILLDLDEITCLEGNEVIFKGKDKVYSLDSETVEAIRKAFSSNNQA